jgi:hypothetical protein
VSLVSLDRVTGKRRWTVPGRGAGGGAPLILNDPDRPGEQLIYHGTYTTVMALRPDGSTVWSAPTGLALPERREGERDVTHVWGMNYQPQLDAVVGVTMDGWVCPRRTRRRSANCSTTRRHRSASPTCQRRSESSRRSARASADPLAPWRPFSGRDHPWPPLHQSSSASTTPTPASWSAATRR